MYGGPELDQVLYQIRESQELVYQFVVFFGRFEYSLKAAGYLQNKRIATADWYGFAASLDIDLKTVAEEPASDAISYLLSEPPLQLVRNGSELMWVRRSINALDNVTIIQMLKDVRNNLLHGGKFPFDKDRDVKLITSATTLLAFLLNNSAKVRQVFHQDLVWLTV